LTEGEKGRCGGSDGGARKKYGGGPIGFATATWWWFGFGDVGDETSPSLLSSASVSFCF
jgi:hypothetical protein